MSYYINCEHHIQALPPKHIEHNPAMNTKDQQIISTTQTWLKTIIIEYSICPFAKRELDRGSIRFSVNHDTEIESCLMNLMLECDRLDTDSSIETTLLIYDSAFTVFDDYLGFLELAETLLIEQGYEGVYQLASFHPDYCFEGAKAGRSGQLHQSLALPYVTSIEGSQH